MGSKHYNTEWKSVWTTGETIMKDKPHLVTFNENILFNLWTFWLTLVYKNGFGNIKKVSVFCSDHKKFPDLNPIEYMYVLLFLNLLLLKKKE